MRERNVNVRRRRIQPMPAACSIIACVCFWRWYEELVSSGSTWAVLWWKQFFRCGMNKNRKKWKKLNKAENCGEIVLSKHLFGVKCSDRFCESRSPHVIFVNLWSEAWFLRAWLIRYDTRYTRALFSKFFRLDTTTDFLEIHFLTLKCSKNFHQFFGKQMKRVAWSTVNMICVIRWNTEMWKIAWN